MATVAEMEVEAAAGPGAWHEEFVLEKARWRLPEGMVRHEGDADPEALRILRVRGNSMEPEMREGDRLVVDTARRVPGAGELFVLWDGDGLVVKRVEPAHEPGPPKLRLHSANPAYPPYTRPIPASPTTSTSSARCSGRLPGRRARRILRPGAEPVPDRAIAAYQLAATRTPTACSAASSFALSRRVASIPSSNDMAPPEPSPSRQPRR